jgi:hypothetical protein
MVLTGYSGARGTLIYENNLMSKISCQTPFKASITVQIMNFRSSPSPKLGRMPIRVAALASDLYTIGVHVPYTVAVKIREK